MRRPPGRRGPGRPPKKQVSGGSEELFSFNEESLEGEKRDERGRGVGGRGVGSEDQRELEDADDEEGAAMMLESSDDGGGGKQRRRRNAAGVQTRRGDGARSFDNEDHELAWQERKDEESANDWRRRASMKGTANGGSRADERIADEWNSDQEEDEEEEEEDDDEDEWHDDEEDESWVDVSSDGENEITPEDDEEEAAVVAELKAAEEIRAVAEVMRREEEDLRRAIAASMAMTAAAPGASMDDHQMVLSEPMPDNPERAAVKVEPWVPAKTETPLTLRRLRCVSSGIYSFTCRLGAYASSLTTRHDTQAAVVGCLPRIPSTGHLFGGVQGRGRAHVAVVPGRGDRQAGVDQGAPDGHRLGGHRRVRARASTRDAGGGRSRAKRAEREAEEGTRAVGRRRQKGQGGKC